MYLTATDAIKYGIIDKIVDKSAKAIDEVLNSESWDKAAGLVKV
jgi:ATP-dependent protease ClpP protease subunit